MALRGVLDHPKTYDLAARLGVGRCVAMGILEALWHKTAALARDGSIGRRISNAMLVQLIDWKGDADTLVNHLVDAGWLETHPLHRLLVHDWHVHSDNTLDAQLMREGLRYANNAIPRGSKIGKAERADLMAKFYSAPAADLFQQAHVQQETQRQEVQRREEAAPNVVPFGPAPASAAKSLPVPEPVPVVEREIRATAVQIACAHPSAVERHLQPHEVPAEDVMAVMSAIRAEAQSTGASREVAAMVLLNGTRAYAQAVSQWPPGEHRFILPLSKFLHTREYRKDPALWRRDGTRTGNTRPAAAAGGGGSAITGGGAATGTAAQQRYRANLHQALNAFGVGADLAAAATHRGAAGGADPANGRDDGELPHTDHAAWVGGDHGPPLGGADSAAWHRRSA